MEGFITLHRQLLEWEWFTDINVTHLFIYCLLKANHAYKKWRGFEIERGSFITSISHLSIETGLTIQQVRTALNKLKKSEVVTSYSQGANTVITVNNYDKYQSINKPSNTSDNKEVTSYQQGSNKEVTTNNNDNNDNNENNINVCMCTINGDKDFKNKKTNTKKITDIFHNDITKLYRDEYRKVFGQSVMLTREHCEKLSELAEWDTDIVEHIKIAIHRLKYVNFEFKNGSYKPSSAWLLKNDNFVKVVMGEFGEKGVKVKSADEVEQEQNDTLALEELKKLNPELAKRLENERKKE